MGVERYVVEAVVRDGRSHRDVARSAGVSKAWVTKLLARYREGGDAALRWFSTSGDRHAGARLINLYAIAGIALVVIGSIGAVVMSTAAPYLIDQYQSTSPPGKQSIELVFGVRYRAVVVGMWRTLETIPFAASLIGTAVASVAQRLAPFSGSCC
jgi:Homeodomain-like domain